MGKLINIDKCWCGSSELSNFSSAYLRCKKCNTLIASPRYPDEVFEVVDDENNFYGQKYWTEHVKKDYDLPDIFERMVSDLSERCVYWLKIILQYIKPGSKTLELGCGPGGLVYLMKLAGFKASGSELSPWLCKTVNKIFDVPMLVGKIEDLELPDGSMDAILLMDVLEHMVNPEESLKIMNKKLSNNGIVILQTPRFNNGTYEDLISTNDKFCEQLKEKEHLYLFNKDSIIKLLRNCGFDYISFESPIFPYDMFVIASKKKISCYSTEEIEKNLLNTPHGRIILSLINLFNDNEELKSKIVTIEGDREERLQIINKLSTSLSESESDRQKRLELINSQHEIINRSEHKIKKIEEDRERRLEIIKNQAETMRNMETKMIEIEEDRERRLEVINNQQDLITEINKQKEDVEKEYLSAINKLTEMETKIKELNNAKINRVKEIEKLNLKIEDVFNKLCSKEQELEKTKTYLEELNRNKLVRLLKAINLIK